MLRALQSLPGVARTPFGLGGLALRGTAPRDTKVYLDGIEVPLLYHFGGLASFLPTAAVDQVTLEPGGASVRYGRGLGGVAVVTSRTGRRDRTRVGGELSLIHAAVVGEARGPRKGGWLVGVRRSYFDAIIEAARLDLALLPRYMDAQVRWESGDGRWMAILFGSDDQLTLNNDPGDAMQGGIDTSNVTSFGYTSRFVRLGLRYRAVRGATSLTLSPSVGIDDVNARANHNDIDKGLHRWMVPVSLRAELAMAVGSELPVLMLGDSGVGKTLLARAIAEASGRLPMVRAMLGAADDLNTITSELFGHERGAFSGALATRTGLVGHADGGTLVLDEILNLPAHAQQLLLDFTQFGTYRPLGHAGAEPRHARTRIIAVTNGDLEAAVRRGAFREDLFYRLGAIVVGVAARVAEVDVQHPARGDRRVVTGQERPQRGGQGDQDAERRHAAGDRVVAQRPAARPTAAPDLVDHAAADLGLLGR